MASTKNRKSKGRAVTAISIGLDLDGRPCGEWRLHSTEYDYRKAQFADLPPAKLVRPLRAVRSVYERALAVWQREVVAFNRGQGPMPAFPHGEQLTYRNAVRFAKAGQGQLVHRCAS